MLTKQTYGYESRILNENTELRVQSLHFELGFFRRTSKISYAEPNTTEYVLRTTDDNVDFQKGKTMKLLSYCNIIFTVSDIFASISKLLTLVSTAVHLKNHRLSFE